MRYKDKQGLRRTKLRVGLIEFFCQWLTQEPSPRLGLSSSSGLEENLIESSLNSTILYIYIYINYLSLLQLQEPNVYQFNSSLCNIFWS